MSKRLLAIYDFSVFPYALGDLTTWFIKKNCQAIRLNYSEILFILISSDNVNFYQNKNLLKEKNKVLEDLISIPSYLQIRNKIKIVHNYSELTHLKEDKSIITYALNKKILESFLNKKERNSIIHFLIHPQSIHFRVASSLYRAATPLRIRKIITPILKKPIIKYFEKLEKEQNSFINDIASHRDLNSFFKKNKHFPFLSTNKNKIKNNIISMQFRFRKLDSKVFGLDAIERDASIIIWSLIINLINRFFPTEKIYLLGRAEEKPPFLKNLNNVYIRNKSQSLQDDLNIMLNSSIFLGSSSGFAAIANFSELPYLITKVNKDARQNYDISSSSKKLPFARPNQVLVDKEDPLEIMSFYCKIKKQDFSVIKNYFKNKSKLFAKLKDKESFILDNSVIQNNNFFINEYLVNSKIKDENIFYLYLISTLNQ